jgi:hypothetical protein
LTTTDPNDAGKSRSKFATIVGSIILIPPPIRRVVFGGFFLALLAVDIALAETHHFWAMLSVAAFLILSALALITIWWPL